MLLFRPRRRFAELPQLPLVIGAGVVSGLIGLLAAILLEGRLEPHLDVPFAIDLWLSGPIEEACKIAVPVLLLIFARNRFVDPRAGVLMVLVSGAVFGVGEGLFSWRQQGSQNDTTDRDLSMSDVAVSAIGGNIISIVAAVITFLVLRHVLREMAPPTAVAENPTHWRPRLAFWGVPSATREQWASEQSGSGGSPIPRVRVTPPDIPTAPSPVTTTAAGPVTTPDLTPFTP